MRKFATLVLMLLALVGANGLAAANSNPTVLITEAAQDPSTPTGSSGSEFVEIMNVTSSPINIAGYKIVAYDPGPAVLTTKVLTGKVLMPLEVYVVGDTSAIGGSPFNNEYIGVNLDYGTGGQGGFMLLDNNDVQLDFMSFGGLTPSGITLPHTPTWTGAAVIGIPYTTTLQRMGTQDHDDNTDWSVQTASVGFANMGLNIVTGTQWNGSISSDWNDAANWASGLPTAGNGAIIPDAATTANDPTFPPIANIKSLKIEAGGIVFGGNNASVVKLTGEFTQLGTYIPGNAIIELNGSGDQEVTTSLTGVGSLRVTNTGGTVIVLDEWTSANTGMITLIGGAKMRFDSPTLDFSGNTFQNDGLISFGLTAGGVMPALQSITANGKNLGHVKVEVADAMDTVSFNSAVGFRNLEVTGLGNVDFLADVAIDGTTNFGIFSGLMTFGGNITGTGNLVIASAVDITIPGSVNAASLTFTGSAVLTITGSLTTTGNVGLTSVAPTAVFNSGAINAGGVFTSNFGGLVGPTIGGDVNAVTANFMDGNLVSTGSLITTNTNFASADPVSFAGNANVLGATALTSTGTLTIGNATFTTLTVGDTVSLSGANVSVTGNLTSTTAGTIAFSGTLTANGPLQQTLQSLNTLEADRFIVSNLVGVNLGGKYWFRSNSGVNPALDVVAGAGLIVQNSAKIELGNVGGGALMRTAGSLITSAGDVGVLRPEFSARTGANKARMVMTGTATVNFDGVILTNFGNPNFAYGVQASANSNLLAFNFVTMTGIQALSAAIGLESLTVPGTMLSIFLEGTGSNVDATALMNLHINITEPVTGGGNLYGVPNEIDPNGVIFWDNPPTVDILGSGTLPSALVGNFYQQPLMAVGGNQPLTWALANAPDWLSISPTTGELTGTPLVGDIGTRQFVVIAADSSTTQQIGNKILSITVDSLTTVELTIITNSLTEGKIGTQYGFSLTASGGNAPYFWSVVNVAFLPPGISLSQSGQLIGAPTGTGGVYTFQVRVTDGASAQAIKSLSLTVRTAFNDPGTVAGALSDGGGGCALSGAGQNLALLLSLLALAGLLWRRRKFA